MYQFFPYITFSIISFVTLTTLAAYGVYKKRNLGANEFVFAMIVSAWWVFCQAFELMALTLPIKLFWANLLYIGAGLSPFAYFLLVLRYTGHDRFITRRNIAIILSIYLIFFSLIFTDQYFGLMRTNISLDTSAVPYVIDKDFGMVFPLYMLYVHSMGMISIALLVVTAIRKESVYRKQALILLVSLCLIAFSNLIHILGLSPSTRFELTPALFGFAGIAISWGIFRHKLLDLTPIARDLLVERIKSGIIVFDINNHVTDINNTALKMFGLEKSQVIGRYCYEIPGLAEYVQLKSDNYQPEEVVYNLDDNQYIYEIAQYHLLDTKDIKVGQLVIVNDITEKKEAEEKNINQERALSIMQERERVSRELHDGLAQVFGYYNTQAQAIGEYLNRAEYESARQHLENLIIVAQDHHGVIREQIADIRGIAAVNKNFSAALKQHVDIFSKKYNIPVKIFFGSDLPQDFPEEIIAVELSKIAQEALTNIQKHAGDCQVSISFQKKQDFIEFRVNDTGRGFNPTDITDSNGYGLNIIRERAALIGATCTIESKPGKGTTILVKMDDKSDFENNNC